jgi:hypothetical protein
LRLALPHDLRASATVYAALQTGLIDPIASARLVAGDALLGSSLRWQGRSYGIELMLERSLTKKLGGHLAYTLARSERSFGRLRAPAPFDRTHVLSGSLAYALGRRWRAGARGSFYTGIPMEVAYPEAARDPPRTTPFFRLDWRVEKSWRVGESSSISLVLEVMNTTFQREALEGSCSAYLCKTEEIGPVTVPSIGVEAYF